MSGQKELSSFCTIKRQAMNIPLAFDNIPSLQLTLSGRLGDFQQKDNSSNVNAILARAERHTDQGTHPPSRKKQKQTYNSRDSLLVTHATTNRPQGSLSMEERTGFRVFYLLSYVEEERKNRHINRLSILWSATRL
ncbi:hypothetical protein IWZ02DRAFT_318755 [Phyllosticta citriasiana]